MITAESVAQSRAELFDSVRPLLDDRTIHILEHRREDNAVVRRRGWLVRRMLLLADVVGLSLAFAVAELVFADGAAHGRSRWGTLRRSCSVSCARCRSGSLARLYGLYEHDEERTDHSTVDELVGVFHLVTVGAWLFLARHLAERRRRARPVQARALLGARDRAARVGARASRARSAGAQSRTCRTRSSSAPATSDN